MLWTLDLVIFVHALFVRSAAKFVRKNLKDEVDNYLSKKYAPDQASAENDAAILPCAQPPNITPQQYTDDLIAK